MTDRPEVSEELKAELVDLKGALEQWVANTKPYREVRPKLIRIARWWLIIAFLIGLFLGGGVGVVAHF
jgi:hypothetical protein